MNSKMPARAGFLLLLLLGIPAVSLDAGDWSHWRGANRNDVVSEPSGWSGGQWPGAVRWKKNIGIGCASPIIVDGKLYTLGWAGNKDHLWCLDAVTGKEIWRQSYACGKYGRLATGDQGLYAGPSSTAEYDADTGFLYTLSLDGHLNCWDTGKDGERVWGLNLYDRYKVKRRPDVASTRKRTLRDYGYSSSPLVHDDWLLVEVGDDTGTLMAFSKTTGEEIWKSECKDEAGHTGGPVPIRVEGVPCAAVLTLRNLVVIRLDKGNEGKTVASYKWTTDFANNIATPTVHNDLILISSAYNHYAMCCLKISLRGATKVWEQPNPTGVCSPVIYKGNIYWAWRGVHCVDLKTGKEKWKGGKVGSQGSCIVTADDRLISWTNRGDLSLAETAERSPGAYRALIEKRGVMSSDAWPHVVLSGGNLYCKDRNGNVTCFSLKASAVVNRPTNPPTATPRPNLPPPKNVDLKSWPGEVLLAWDRQLGSGKLLGTIADGNRSLKLDSRGSAAVTSQGLELSKGAIVVNGANDQLLRACKGTNELTLEISLAATGQRQTGPARIISFSTDGYSRNFTLAQEGDQLLLRLRTTRTGTNGLKPQTNLLRIEANKAYHLVVAYRDGQLVCYVNGRKTLESNAVGGTFTNWSPQHLLLGDEWDGGGTRNWSGRIERFAILNRFVSEAEAKKRYELATAK